MIVPADRARLLAHLDRCLSAGALPHALDDDFESACRDSRDETVREISDALVGFGALFERDRVMTRKADWDTVQRLRLVLAAGLELQPVTREHFHVSQLAAIYTLLTAVCTGAILWHHGLSGYELSLAIGLPALLATAAILHYRLQAGAAVPPPADPLLCAPFPSVHAIVAARKQVPRFHRSPYRPPAAPPTAAQPGAAGRELLPAWLLFGGLVALCLVGAWTLWLWPAGLLYACTPISRTHLVVADPEEDWFQGRLPA